MVYLILDRGSMNKVKIGWSKNPHNRIRQLQTGHPNKLELIAQWNVPRYYEKRIHRALFLKKTNTLREWFSCSDIEKLIEVITTIVHSKPL
ncbi:GIY-YIG nuclease family protein [Cyanobacterium aponinum UTEX 3222]|uniref:GIY-YIG nuclease family protein n=1 Tax=Cyanobacterium aponinum TaxID=379064 RepID=UPI003087DA70|nr:GIY-YIG nuclease family protein [Cyanobacterium aponinum UTEX 3222]